MTAVPELVTLSTQNNYLDDGRNHISGNYIRKVIKLQHSEVIGDPEVLDNPESEDEGRFNANMNSVSDDEVDPVLAIKKRTQRFSDSDSNANDSGKSVECPIDKEDYEQNPDRDNSNTSKDIKKTRIKKMDSSDSENNSSDNSIDHERSVDIRKSVRREDKQSSLKDKFKSLLSNKNTLKMSSEDEDNGKHHSNSEHSDDEFSCLKIKQKVKSATQAMKSICDPDTSDEEDNSHNKPSKRKSKPKMTKPTSPKPMRMTAKQAMENMQKIKSESNRMLREKGVSLPYHRPKALTLKDIMNRRKPAVSSDGKTLPIKMNEEQLRQYAMLLEQRQKEVIELCKSDTDEEEKEDEINDETNEEKTAVNENNLISTKPITNIEQSTVSISNHGMENEHSHVESCIEDDGVNVNEKPPETSKPLEVAMETDPSNKNVGNPICGDVTEKGDECIETELQENILLQNEVAEESQNIMLHYESEKINMNDMDLQTKNGIEDVEIEKGDEDIEDDLMKEDDISDCDINIDEIDKIIEEAEINCDKSVSNKSTPKLTGAPGILINLDDEETEPRKLSGVELLKERFTFFAKIKTMEDMEKDREKKFKPGTQHLKLKQELEEQIAEQRSLEWEKRLQEEKQLKSEINGENDEDDIERLESKLEEIDKKEIENEEDSSESEEELLENDVVMEDKPKRRNPMVDDEAEISDDDDDGKGEALDGDADAENESDEESDTDESSSDSEDESKPRKGRILKAFEDSDDEKENEETIKDNADIIPEATIELEAVNGDAIITESQDDELPLAQMYKSSDDLFSTQSTDPGTAVLKKNTQDNSSVELVSQTICLSNPDLSKMIKMDINPDNMNVCGTQSDDVSMDGIVGMCSGSFTQNLVSSQMLPPPLTQSQEFGDDIAAMCTGKFYENPLVSQESIAQEFEDKSRDIERDTSLHDAENISQNEENHTNNKYVPNNMKDENKENTILNSILDELDDLDDKPKQNKYFASGAESKDLKKKFTIDSDDETNETSPKKLKKFKKKRAEKRALQISDDEEDELSDAESEIVEDGDEDRVVEYDSEENEIEVMQPNAKQPKKSIRNFFENEAELSSEDEWIGSGDEDERGLDIMEREEGDDETFHQGQLRRELGQIHMREVLDQDKREVRLIQELLFEDGDLGDGHRQRKFRWRNADGEEDTGTYPEQFADTQEEEFESEEQWRKERHEREMFIRKMREKDEEEKNISINRNTIIKANLSSRSMSTLTSETKTGKTVEKPVTEKKTSKDIPSPKKGFTIFQQNYHTSMLTRGRGALARLAALATPLADDDAPRNISKNRGNFVFTAITPDDKPKVTIKRKAEKIHTPRLIKKLKTDDSNIRKPSLFDHIKT